MWSFQPDSQTRVVDRPGEECFSLGDGHGSLASLPFSSAVSCRTGEGSLFHVTEWYSLAKLYCCEVCTGWQSWSYLVALKALTVPISKCLHGLSMTVGMWELIACFFLTTKS